MKTTSRKRLLVSSVAMLLVAILALGTATFAWFTSSTTATAKNINVKTIKSSELVISKLDKSWGTTINYQTGYDATGNKTGAVTLLPVSSADGSNWFTTTAALKTSAAADTTKAASDVSLDTTNYVFKEQLNVKNKGEATVNDVKITFALDSSSTKTGYYRVALVPVTDSEDNTDTLPSPTASFFATKAIPEDAPEGTPAVLTNIYGASDTTGYQALTGTNVSTNLSTKVQPNTATEISVGNLASNVAKYYNLYVWFEGQDKDCYDTNAGAAIPQITFTVQGTTASES